MKKLIKAIKKKVMNEDAFLASERLEVCNSCEMKGGKCAVPLTDPCCGVCGCSLSLLKFSDECPHPDGNKWKDIK